MATDYENVQLVCPVKEPIVLTQGYGMNPQGYARFGYAGHNGIDYYSSKRFIYAAHTGVIDRVGWDPGGYGNYIIIEAFTPGRCRYETLYAHLSEVRVHVGQEVTVGSIIGVMGTTGNSSGIHLHFELRLREKPKSGYPRGQVDPQPYYMAAEPVKPPTPTPSPTVGEGNAIVNAGTDGLSVRLGPGADYTRVAVLPTGTEVTVIELEGDWAAVKFYMHAGYLREKGE